MTRHLVLEDELDRNNDALPPLEGSYDKSEATRAQLVEDLVLGREARF
jgi:hypothetical protein